MEREKSEQQEYKKSAEEKLRKLGARIDQLRAKGESIEENMKKQFSEQIDNLSALKQNVENKVQWIAKTGRESWGDIRGGIERSLDELENALKNAASRFH